MDNDIRDAIDFYGFLIPLHETISGEEFASRIKGYYSLEHPRNRYYYNVVKDRLVTVTRSRDGFSGKAIRTNQNQ